MHRDLEDWSCSIIDSFRYVSELLILPLCEFSDLLRPAPPNEEMKAFLDYVVNLRCENLDMPVKDTLQRAYEYIEGWRASHPDFMEKMVRRIEAPTYTQHDCPMPEFAHSEDLYLQEDENEDEDTGA